MKYYSVCVCKIRLRFSRKNDSFSSDLYNFFKFQLYFIILSSVNISMPSHDGQIDNFSFSFKSSSFIFFSVRSLLSKIAIVQPLKVEYKQIILSAKTLTKSLVKK